MPDTTEALTEDNLRSLRRLAAQGPTEARWLKVAGITAATAGALLLLALRAVTPDLHGLPQTLVLVLGVGGLLLLGWVQLWRPLQASMANGVKQVRRGRLSEVEALTGGKLRYVIDGQALDLLPLAGPLEPHALPHGSRIRDLQSLRDAEVALHWVARGKDNMLLEWLPLDAAPAIRVVLPSSDADLHHAHRPVRQLLGFFAVMVPVIALIAAAQAGFEARAFWNALAVGGAVWLLMAGIGALLAWRRHRQPTHVHTFTGTLSEQFCTVSQVGTRPSQTRLWYRIGGHLLQVPARIAGVQLGDPLTAHYLVRSDVPEADALLTHVERAGKA